MKVTIRLALYLTMLATAGLINLTSLNTNLYALEKDIKIEIETEQGNNCEKGSECTNNVFSHYCDKPVCIISFKTVPFALTLPTTTSLNATYQSTPY